MLTGASKSFSLFQYGLIKADPGEALNLWVLVPMMEGMADTRRTAVICDDDPVARGVVATLLDEAGFVVAGEVTKATDAIDLCRYTHPAVIVLDISLMGLSGIEALPALHEASPATRVVLFTAFGSFAAQGQPDQPGIVALVDKTDTVRLGVVLADL